MTDSYSPHFELEITELGAMADGLGHHNGDPVFVPLTCPGDTVEVAVTRKTKDSMHGEVVSIITPSPDRQTPPCEHFGACGGCSLQHLNEARYQAFKQKILESFITGIGVSRSVIAPMVEIKTHSRRRADFKIETQNNVVSLGFFMRGSHELIDLTECPISDTALSDILPALRECFSALKKPGRLVSISLTVLENGLDATIKLNHALGDRDKETLIAFVKNSRIIRLNTQVQPKRESRRQQKPDDPICLYDEGNATIAFAGIEVALPAGAFLQATEKGQHAITDLVTEHLHDCKVIADLYSGCGTYSFPLIKQAQRVSAYEGADEMGAAMNNACVAYDLDDKISTTVRDLFKNPLSAKELNYFDGLVINPPRNGALPQIQNIGKSKVSKVVVVSCDPGTFKRDAKHLLESGYTLTTAVPIDQFYWSRHLELVAVFEKTIS